MTHWSTLSDNDLNTLLDIRRDDAIEILKELSARRLKVATAKSSRYQQRVEKMRKTAYELKKILRVGMIVKVQGARSKPYREVIQINKDTIAGYTCKRVSGKWVVDITDPRICGIDKITQVVDVHLIM